MSSESSGKVESNLVIQISDLVWQKVFHWIEKCPVEVSGLGKVEYDPAKGIFQVVDAYLVDQENTGSETEMKDAAVAKLMYEAIQDDPAMMNGKRRLCWWWHSHVNMRAFWSGTDHETIRKIGGQGWAIATVFNKRREYRSAYFQASPNSFMIDNLPTRVGSFLTEEITKAWDSEYDSKVKEKKTYLAENGKGYAAPYGYPPFLDSEVPPKFRERLHNYYKHETFQRPPGFENKTEQEESMDDSEIPDDGVELTEYDEIGNDPVSLDPRDGDESEIDALDLMNENLKKTKKKPFYE